MIAVKNEQELKEIVMSDRDRYIGEMLIDESGLKYLVVDLNNEGIKILSMNLLVKYKNRRKYLEDARFPTHFLDRALKNIELFEREINQSYA